MPKRHIDAVDVDYYLMLLDADGKERPERDGSLLSATLAEMVTDGVTDVFIASHGWKGDVPAAISQYDRWIAAMAGQSADRKLARELIPGFKALTIGIHWPSLPFGDERAEAAVLGEEDDDELANEREMSEGDLVDRYAERIVDTPGAREALATIIAQADDLAVGAQIDSGTIPPDLEAAYQALFAEAGLGSGGVGAAPGEDQDTFSPLTTAQEWTTAIDESGGAPVVGTPGVLGGGFLSSVRDKVLSPVRQMSFWAMKHRARTVGERDVHTLVSMLQSKAPGVRIHLMGHSFGCIVMTAAVAGPLVNGKIVDPLPRPVDSLFLVQGAMSLWSFADTIPFPPSVPGYFRVLRQEPRAVSGPIVTTLSSHDRAVGVLFPIGAKLGGDLTLGPDDLPQFGGIGSFGVQGTEPVTAIGILSADSQYQFTSGATFNIDASRIIANGGGLSGAHSDIAHDEVAHIFWQAALTGV